MKKKYKVVRTPTSGKSPLGMHDGKLEYAPNYGFSVFNTKLNHEHNPQHLHFISEEEIKVGDYITDGYKVWQWRDDSSLLGRKKVVATSDKSLTIKNDLMVGNKGRGVIKSDSSLPQIPQSFLEEYCKNPVEEVYLEHNNGCHICEGNINMCNNLPNVRFTELDREDCSTFYQLELTPNNEVIISSVEEKTYSREELIPMFRFVFKSAIHYEWDFDIDTYIKENL